MEISKANKKRIMRNKSITSNSNKRIFQFERSNSNSNFSSISNIPLERK